MTALIGTADARPASSDLTPSGAVIKPMGTHYGNTTIRELYPPEIGSKDSWKQAFKTAIDSDSDTVTITGNAKGCDRCRHQVFNQRAASRPATPTP